MKRIFVLGLFICVTLATMAQHTIVLKNGQKMNGTVESMKDGVINFEFMGNDMKLKMSEVRAIYFDEKDVPALQGNAAVMKTTPKGPGEKTIASGSYMVRYKCGSRVIVKAPLVSNLTEEKGTVVVDISIDKYGHVLKATPGASGTTTDSDYLRTKAKQAAESAMFDNVPTAPLETTGYMIFTY